MRQYFPKPNFLRANVKGELDLSNYETKADLGMQEMLIHQNLLKN